MLSDIVEVTDAKWQGAVEGVLGGYASVVLLERSKDATAAYKLAEKERYRHFIVPECISAPVTKDDSLLSVVRFSAPAPSWLIDQLARTPTTANGAAAARCSSKPRATASARPAAPAASKRCNARCRRSKRRKTR
jgi:chromosome segregation ATPase